jgi:hypothetical protein
VEEEHQLTPIACPVCGTKNDPSFSYCSKCTSSLLPGLGQDLTKFTEQIERLLSDPLIDETTRKFAKLDKQGIYGPHLQQEADFLNSLSKMAERQTYIIRLLANQPTKIAQQSDVGIAASGESQDVRKIRKPRGR